MTDNRARLIVTPGGPWRLYQHTVPPGMQMLGTVQRGMEIGALARTQAIISFSLDGIVIDAKSGASGAGRKAQTGTLFCEVSDTFRAYNLGRHRHTPEIEQIYSEFAGEDVVIQFTPHLLPVDRGIYATCYAQLKQGVTDAQIEEAYQAMYGDEFFIRLRGKGVCPELKNIRGSNYVDLGWQTDKRTGRIIVMNCIDNLVKGAAGQAVQNMNVMFGIDEAAGLRQLPLVT